MSAATQGALLVACCMLAVRALRPTGSRASNAGRSLPVSLRHYRGRTSTASDGDWATFLDTTCSEVRSGSSLTAALAHARARHPDLAVRLDLSATTSDPDLAVVTQTVSAALELGGPIAATLHRGAALLRERSAQRAEAQAHSAQARLSAKVLTVVPLLFATWSAASSASFRQAIASPTGLLAASTGLLTNGIGWWWMHRIIQQATP